ncbi:MAG: sugar phosphate isomerase/epimerase [Verrucomicrobiota bacterium]
MHPLLRFGFSLYGMKGVEVDRALRACAEIGYDCVEFVAMPGWPTDPQSVSTAERRRLRDLLVTLKLTLPAIMENLLVQAEEEKHRANLERLREAADLGHALSPKAHPVIETVLGGKPGQWTAIRDRVAERLMSWAEVGREMKTVIAVKPHVSNALRTPEDARWLARQVNSPWLKLAFDFSHFQLQGYKLADAIVPMAGQTRFVHIKDAEGDAKKVKFLLPGEGNTDYAEYFRLLKANGYRDAIVVEVSGQVFNQPGYDPMAAARKCFEKVAPAFAKI